MAEKIIISGVLVIITKWLPAFHLTKRELGPFINFGSKITASRIIYFFLSRVDVIIIGRTLGAQTLGAYNLALQFSNVIFQLITSTGINVAYPLFSKMRDSELFLRQILKSEEIVAFIAIPALAGLALIAPDIIAVTLGDHWSEAATYLRFLCVATLFQVIGFLFPQAINAINKTMVNVYLNGISLFISIVALYISAGWGMKTLLITLILLSAARFLATLTTAKIVLGVDAGHVLWSIVKNCLISAAMVAISFLATKALFSQSSSYLKIISMITIGVVSYATLQLIFARKQTIDLLHSLAKK
jgi:O-antigen/teichoic acid export membrane protein